MATTAEDKLIHPADAASFLGVAQSTLNNWRVQRTGPAFVKVGRLVRYRESALRAFVRDVGTSDQPAPCQQGGRDAR